MTRAVVIGSGFGGLALAIRLQAAGIATILLEQRDRPGGRAYVYEQDGYVFDAGPTVITDPTCLEELFAIAGRRMADYVELIPITPFYQLRWEDGTRFDYYGDQQALEAQIRAISPGDIDGYRRFHAYAEELLAEGYIRLGAQPFLSVGAMVRVAPQLARLESWRSVYAKVSRFIQSEKLRQAFSFHTLLVGGNPFNTSSIYSLIHALERRWGVWFPRGGTGALVRALVRLFEDLGGELRVDAKVDEIRVEGGVARGVRLASGETIEASLVASNADVVHTYAHLLRGTARGRQQGAALARRRFSNSLFVVYFGTGTPPPNDMAHHVVLFGPRYRELIADIFDGPRLPDDFSLYLHSPSVTDPSLAPPGHAAWYVLAPVPHLGAARIDWDVEGPRYRDRIFAYLEERAIPGLSENLTTSRIFTPADFARDLNAHLGSAFSLEPVLTQSAWFRPHNRDDRISNLYFVGAGTHPGAGVPGVIGSAKATARLMIADAGQRMAAE